MIKNKYFLYMAVILLFTACKENSTSTQMTVEQYNFDLQGHRGARGILPENSLEGFQKAIELGVTTLELDVVISKDSMVVVSHEAYMNPQICVDSDGKKVVDKSSYNLYEMNYEEIKAFDCGSLKHPDFPEQKSLKTYKPLLSEVIKLSNQTKSENGGRINLNIELKSSQETDNIYHPEPEEFVDLVVKTIRKEVNTADHITIQSFDERILRYCIDQYTMFNVAYLVEDGNFTDNLKKLGKTPQIYSPYYKLVDSSTVNQVHKKGMKIIPWTVNDMMKVQELLEMGVDGIITDYPNKAKVYKK